MREYFIVANSFAAPFCSDQTTHFVEAEAPEAALYRLAGGIYKHPAGLYSAACYNDASSYHKGEQPLAKWLSNHARATVGAGSLVSHGPGLVEIDGKARKIKDPKEGAVV